MNTFFSTHGKTHWSMISSTAALSLDTEVDRVIKSYDEDTEVDRVIKSYDEDTEVESLNHMMKTQK